MTNIKKLPIISNLFKKCGEKLDLLRFRDSKHYWEDRYASGGNSGSGSYNKLAEFKSEVINAFVCPMTIF